MADKVLVVKTKFNDDLRRFNLNITTTYDNLCEHIEKLYNITLPYKIKYCDDENDLITISETIDLIEAIRFTSAQIPPILRITIFSTVNGEVVEKGQTVEKQQTYDDEKEYPPLSVDQWDAPKKEEVVILKQQELNIQPIVQNIQPIVVVAPPQQLQQQQPQQQPAVVVAEVKRTIAQMARDISAATSQSVISSSLSTTVDTNAESKNIMDTLANDRDANNIVCSNLSKQIAEDCSALSRTTSDFCEAVSKVTREETLSKDIVKQVEILSNSTLDIVGRLSKETAQICSELSFATIALSQTVEEQKKATEQLRKQSDELQKLSRSVYESSVIESNATLLTIKNL